MQTLKDEVKKRIDENALNLFMSKGYKGVSMRSIATISNMTVGNIYRYYKNKDELFVSLLEPSILAIEALLGNQPQVASQVEFGEAFYTAIIDMFLQIHQQHSRELYVLVNGCEGSPLSEAVFRVTDLLSEKIASFEAYNQQLQINKNFMGQVLAKSIIHNFIEILYHFDDDQARRAHMIHTAKIYTHWYMTSIMKGGNL